MDFEKLQAAFDSSIKDIRIKSENVRKCFDKMDLEKSIHEAFKPYNKMIEKLNLK
ncbi:hypothetical protein [Sporomusa aerivorans]|uniref:hypothetical protein n=1 Tax=Sporomusa aerivorans TaxID=204936 RepID=UPI003529FCCC